MTFSAWLHDQLDREDPIGELATLVSEEDLFPEHGNRAIFEGFFETFDRETQDKFARAWEEFEAAA